MKLLCSAALVAVVLGACNVPHVETEPTLRPNIVFIMADDLGYGDLACYGNIETRTPEIDRLAREGVRFTNVYSNGPECSPTRTALMTGRYQHRVGGLECAIGTGNVGRYAEKLVDPGEIRSPARHWPRSVCPDPYSR